MSDEINKSINSIMETVTTYREKMDKVEADAVTKSEVANIETALKQDLADLREMIAQKQAAPLSDQQADEAEMAKKAFAEAVHGGDDTFNDWVKKSASNANFSNGSAGGVLFPPSVSPDLTRVIAKRSAIYDMATKISGGANWEKRIKEDRGGSAVTIAENGTRATQNTGTYANLKFTSREIYGEQAYTTWMADQGSIVDIVSEVQADVLQNMADQFSDYILNSAVTNSLDITGSTLTPAVGLRAMTIQAGATPLANDLGKIGGVATAANKAVVHDDLFNLIGATHSSHKQNAKFVFGTDVELGLIKAKETGTGAYIWGTSASVTTSGTPFTIGGYGYAVDDFIPALSGMADNGVVALFGDFSKIVVNEIAGISWLVNPYLTRGQVILSARMRIGAGLVDYSAVRALTNKAAS